MIIHKMKWAGNNGFTIVEVLIVLGVSGVILASSVSLFSGRRASTEFSQAMYDLQSKFQSYSTDISTTSIPVSQAYTCARGNSLINGKFRPYLTPTAQTNDSTANQNCIYLGKALQIIPGGTNIYAYPVLGLRTTSNGDSPSTSSDASPEPALDVSGSNWYLTETYPLLNGVKVVSAKFSGNSTEQDFLALYTSLQSGNTSGSQASAFSRNITFAQSDYQSAAVRNCIEEVSCGTAVQLSTSWNLCVQNDAGSRQAQLGLKNTSTGVTTTLNMAGCS